jgi:hypothetical protein
MATSNIMGKMTDCICTLCDKPCWGLWQEEYGRQEYHGEDCICTLCDKPGWGLGQEEYDHQEYHWEDDSHSCQCAPVQPLQQSLYLKRGNAQNLI